MFSGKIRIDKKLLKRAQELAEIAGYSSIDEFVTHLIERELSRLEQSDSGDEEVKKRLRGLGYL